MGRRILVTGSRDWKDFAAIVGVLRDWREPGAVLVHGGAKGADRMAAAIWRSWGLPVEEHPADWKKYGQSAGFVRNRQMVTAGADVCLAFIKNGSLGATDCAERAHAAGIPVHPCRQDDAEPEHGKQVKATQTSNPGGPGDPGLMPAGDEPAGADGGQTPSRSRSKDGRSRRAKDWAHTKVGDPAPCVLCGQPALMRDPYTNRPCHKTCAMQKAANNGEPW